MSDNLARVLRPTWLPAGATAPEHGEPSGARGEQSTPGDGAQPRHIEIVASAGQRRRRPRVVYALTAVTGIAGIVVAQLLLSVGISQGAYELSTLQDTRVELGRTADSVSEDLVRASSPQSLSANAEALGMVSNSNPVYLRLSDGAVLGTPAAASGTQVGAAGLVPNALLAGVPLVTQLKPAGGQGAGVAAGTQANGKAANGKAANGKAASGKAASGKAANGKATNGTTPAPLVPAPTAVPDGLPSPTTR